MSKKLVAFFSASGVHCQLRQKYWQRQQEQISMKSNRKCHIQRLIWTGWIKVHEARSKCRINLHALPLRTKMQISQRMILFFVGFPIWWYIAADDHQYISGKL